MNKRLTRKQFLKRKTEYLMYELTASLLDKETAKNLTMEQVYKQFPRVSYFKHSDSGVIRVGLSFRGVRKLVKQFPNLTVDDVKTYFNLGGGT